MDEKEQKLELMSLDDLRRHYDGFLVSMNDKRPETKGTYKRALREFVRWFPGEDNFKFQVSDVERYKSYLSEIKHLSDVSVSTYLTALRRFCEYLVSAGVLITNPARHVDGNKRPASHSREALSQADVHRLLDSVDKMDSRGLRDYAVIELMLRCALSEIELIRADVADLQSRDGKSVLFVQGKGRTEKDEFVVLEGDLRNVIDQYVITRTDLSPQAPLFASAGNRTKGQRMTTRGIRARVNFYLESAGIKRGRLRKLTPFSLRHTAALMMVDAGATAEEIRKRLRLGSIATAMLYVNYKNSLLTNI
jgi:integrase/recombinase XerC/integrase/recombinase XerD